MSLWSDFLDTISVRAKEAVNTAIQGTSDIIGGFAGAVAGKTLTPEQPQVAENAVRTEVQRVLAENKKFDINLEQKSNDLILKTAVALNDRVISPYVTRPVSTLGLLTDTESPLYQKGEYESGFQLNDIKSAYNRSAMVSPMQALTKSDLVPLVGSVSASVLEKGGIDLDQVNLWDDKSIEKNFSDNAIGKWYTGIGDFIVGNAALGAAGKVIGMGAKFAGKASGISTKGKTIAEFEKEINDGFTWADTNGTQGTQSVAASHMQELADTKDFAVITQLVDKYSTNPKLIPLLHQTTNREIARDLILADKGNVDAMVRLTKTAPDDLFELADVPGQIQAQTLLTGKVFIPEGPAVQRLQDAFEAAIKRDTRYDELRKTFLDDNYNPLVGGRVGYFPAEPKFATGAYIKAGQSARALKAEAAYREFENLATWAELKIGPRAGGAVTRFVKIAARGTASKPLGYVTFSGVRPTDGHIELNAFIDNIPLFKDGARKIEVAPNVYKKVADIRRDFEATYFKAKSQIDEVRAHEAIDEQIGILIAYNNGWYELPKIKAAIAYFRGEMSRSSQAFQKNGYAIAHDSSRITTNAQTLRQLAESYRYTPWDIIENDFIALSQNAAKTAGQATGATIKSFYEDLTRIWTFDVLARPMFITKQSIVEPIISIGLASGIDGARSAAKTVTMRGLYNARNAVMRSASKKLNKKELAEVNNAVSAKQQTLSKAIAIKDNLQAEYEALYTSKSPALREQHIPQVKKELKAAEKLVDELELDLRAATVRYGVAEAVPSVSLLERRIKWIEKNASPEDKAKLAANIANAKSAITQYKGSINSLATNRKAIQDVEDAITKSYDDIDSYVKELGEARMMQADTFGKSAQYKKGYIGKESQYLMVRGQWVSIDSFVNDASGNNFVRAMRAEVGNARTTEMNYIGELSVGTKKAMIQRKVPNVPINTTSPIYYEELAHVANDLVRRDPLMDLILGETSRENLYRWGLTSEGRSYLQNFGVTTVDQIPSYIDEKVALITRTFPSVEARATILNREVSSQDLQKMLAPYEDRLFEIAPNDWAYAERPIFGNKWYETVENAIGSATSWVFKKLTSPENPLRESFFDKIAVQKVAEKAAYLMDQGIQMTPKRWNALRQSAGREAIQELEKTVYTVRRQNRMLYAARAGVAFPTATLNAFYRYGRLAIKNPQRAVGFLYNYQRGFRTFGVDKNGNPTRNINEITHLVVPGTKELGLGQYDEGIALNARSIGFMLNFPTPSFISALSVGTVMRNFDDSEKWVKDALGPLWETWFPYGAPTSFTKQLTPPWANAAYNAVTGDKGKADYLASYTSVYDYHKMLNEMGIEKKFPSAKELDFETRKLWEQKARWAFISPFGVPIKVQTNKMDLVDTLWYTLMNKYEKQGLSYEDAKTAAGDEMLATMGPKFIVDRVSFSPANARIRVPETPEAWDKIFKKNTDLVTTLSNIRPNDIRLVGLLTADLKVPYEDRNTIVAKKLLDPNLTLPNSSKLVNGLKMRPEEIEVLRTKNRVWEEYTNIRKAIEAKITDGKPLRSHPGLKAGLDYAVDTYLKGKSREWYDEYQRGANGDSAYEYARAFEVITKDKKFMDANINSPFWKDVVAFNAIRNTVVMMYNFLPDGDARKSKIKEAFLVSIAAQSKNFHPELRRIIENYFDNDNMKVVE